MTRKFKVEVVRTVEVIVDETKFTEEFMAEYRSYIDSTADDILDHIDHLGWLFAAGRADDDAFIEGYGEAEKMGIKFREIDDEVSDIEEIK